MIYIYDENSENKELRTVCRPVEPSDIPRLPEIIKTLKIELNKSKIGIAIAANQCGYDLRIVIMNFGRFKNQVMINPEIIKGRVPTIYNESCLSFPGLKVKKVRNTILNVRFKNELFTYETHKIRSIEAICFQHELEHLEGRVLIDT